LSSHQQLFAIIVDLLNNNSVTDPITAADAAGKRGHDDIDGLFLTKLIADQVSTISHMRYYADIVKSTAIRRELVKAGPAIADLGYQSDKPAIEQVAAAEGILYNIAEGETSDFVPVAESLPRTYDEIAKIHQTGMTVGSVNTGFCDLDRLTAGMHPSQLIILAARPAMGKTALAMNIAAKAADNSGKNVGFFSLEMDRDEINRRLISQIGRVDATRMKTGKLGEQDWKRVTDAMNRLSVLPIYVDDTASITTMEMRAKARRLKRKKGLDLIIVDYMQLMRSPNEENRNMEITEISRQMKLLAKELHVPVLCLSQLSRKVELKRDKRPGLSDLRESGAIEQDADLVMMLYRESYYNKNSDDPTTELIIAKHRNGATGTIKLHWTSEFTRFDNMENYEEEAA
jgi:replicative DNA helicase